MKKSYLAMTALAAMLFAGCTSSDEITTLESIKKADNVATPVSFGTYVGRTGTTRALGVVPGLITTSSLQTGAHSAAGFGVFGYYTDHSDYVPASSPINFMYNEQVTYDTDHWTYSPIKYWPNETNATYNSSSTVDGGSTNGGATSTQGPDKLTFFAYAPYANVLSTGAFSPSVPDEGITSISANTTNGDPKINYTIANDADNTVDLLWGVVPASPYSIVSGTTASHTQALTVGLPNLNLTKQTTNETVDFLFKHALAKLTFSVQGSFNEISPSSNDVDGSTRIVVDNVVIATTFHKKGVLNLNNTLANTPSWDTTGDASTITFNINTDDIVAGSAGAAGLRYSGTDNYTSQPLGVTKTKQYLMDSDGSTKFFTLIPETNNLTITITYHVYTVDAQLSTGWSKVTNVITKTISDFTVAGGSWYNINMILGMTSVKFNASVDDWSAENSTNVDLPINVN